MASMEEFAVNMDRVAANVAVAASDYKRRLALLIDQTVVMATPVDTGRARSNWLVVATLEEGTAPEAAIDVPATRLGVVVGLAAVPAFGPLAFSAGTLAAVPFVGGLKVLQHVPGIGKEFRKNVGARFVTGVEQTDQGLKRHEIETLEDVGTIPSYGANAAQEAIARGREVILTTPPGPGAIHIMNNLPYIQSLNAGHSKQAPAGYVEQAIDYALAAIGPNTNGLGE